MKSKREEKNGSFGQFEVDERKKKRNFDSPSD